MGEDTLKWESSDLTQWSPRMMATVMSRAVDCAQVDGGNVPSNLVEIALKFVFDRTWRAAWQESSR